MHKVEALHDRQQTSAEWSNSHLVELAGKYSLSRNYGPGETIFSEGDRGDTMLLILSGQARILKGGTDSRDTTEIAHRGPGDFLGEMALVEESPRFATVIAVTDCEVLEFSREDFEKVIAEQPALAVEVLRSLSGKLRESDSTRIRQLEQSNRRLSETNRKLVHLNLFLDCVIDQSPSAIVLADLQGSVTRLNNAARQMFEVDCDPAELRISDLLPSLDVAGFFNETCVTWQGEASGVRKGEQFPVYLSVASLSGPSTSMLNLHICQDISDLKMLNQTTLDIEKYESAQQTAIELAHDVKNYLGVLLGSMELVLSRLTPEQTERSKNSIKAIETTSQEIVQFVEGIMIYRDSHSAVKPVDLVAIVEGLIRFCQSQGLFRDISLRRRVDREFPRRIALKEDEIRRVLINLMVNAAEAMAGWDAPGDRKIEVELQASPDGRHAVISIHDNGPGISEENLGRLFRERFTTKENGHGIGLVSIQRIIHDHDGDIEVHSEIGQGTTFTIQLPVSGTATDA